jgi:hypothetical protein
MSLWDKLKRAAGSRPTEAQDDGIYFYVRCNRCQDRVSVRLNPCSELQQDFGVSGQESGYFVRKMVVDQRCFRPIEVRMEFDHQRRERSRHIEGGAFLTREEFEAP